MMVLKIGWDFSVVLPVKDAVAIAEILSKSHTWTEKYEGGETVYYAHPCEKEITMKLVPDQLVDMAKLAGKPDR